MWRIMKILLLGNGFDLEHKLPTTYRDFLDFCKSVIAIYTSADCENAKYQYLIKSKFIKQLFYI